MPDMTEDQLVYWTAPDAYGDVALWSGTGPDDPHCDVVTYKRAQDSESPVLWPILVAALCPETQPAPDGTERQDTAPRVFASVEQPTQAPKGVNHVTDYGGRRWCLDSSMSQWYLRDISGPVYSWPDLLAAAGPVTEVPVATECGA